MVFVPDCFLGNTDKVCFQTQQHHNMRNHFILRALCMFLCPGGVVASTDVTEDILVDSMFFKNLGPYVIKQAVTVKAGATLTVEAGTRVLVRGRNEVPVCGLFVTAALIFEFTEHLLV